MNRLNRRALAPTFCLAILGGLASVVLVGQHASARGNVGAPVRQAAPTGHTIAVSGHGEVTVAPDRATITVGTETRGNDAQSAFSANNVKSSAVVAAVQGQGVPRSHIRTQNLSIWFDSEHNQYIVSHDLLLRLDDVNKVGAVLDAAVNAGATSSWGVTFDVKDRAPARTQALQAAVADARKRAEAIAAALGVAVTGVGSASEATYRNSPPIVYSSASRAAAPTPPGSSAPVQAGDLTVSADIDVVYTF